MQELRRQGARLYSGKDTVFSVCLQCQDLSVSPIFICGRSSNFRWVVPDRVGLLLPETLSHFTDNIICI